MAENVKVPPFTEAPSTVVGSTPQTAFGFNFPFWESADILVYVDDVLLDAADYTVEGLALQDGVAVVGGYGSGTVTLDTAVSNVTVTIDRLVVGDRETQFSTSSPLGMRALNADLNRVTARQQDLERHKVTRPSGDRAGLFLAFDANGDETTSAGTGADAGLRTDLAASTGAALVGNRLSAGANLRTHTFSDYAEGGCLLPSMFDGTDQERLERAITEAATERNSAIGQTVQLPRGVIQLSSALNIDNRVTIRGVNKRGSYLQATSSHTGPYMFTVDNGTSSMFDNRLESVAIDCNNVAGLGGVDSQAWQEGGGLRDVLIQRFRTYGVRFTAMDGGAALCRVSDSELFGSASGCTAGIYMNDPSVASAFQLVVENTTLAGGGAAASSMPRAIDVVKGSLHIQASHVENCETGIYLDGNGHHTIIGFNGASSDGGVTNLVEIASTFTGSLTMIGCQRNGATNLLKDNRAGGFGTISYDISYLRIDPEPPLYLGAIVASASIDGTLATPAVSKGFGVSSITDNGTGDYTVTLTRSAQTVGDFAVFASTNQGAGNVRCDLNGVNSVRIRCYAADGTTAVDVNELKLLVVRVA